MASFMALLIAFLYAVRQVLLLWVVSNGNNSCCQGRGKGLEANLRFEEAADVVLATALFGSDGKFLGEYPQAIR